MTLYQPCVTIWNWLLIIVVLVMVSGCSASEDESNGLNDQKALGSTERDSLRFSDDINSMDAIRGEYEKTMQALSSGALDSTSFTYNCHGEKSGAVTYYRSGGTLRMIEREYSEYSHTHGTERYFVSGDSLYYVYRKNTDWAFKTSEETIDTVIEQRFYVLGDTLAQCLTKKYELHSDAAANPDPKEVKPESDSCPPIQELRDRYERLLSHKEETAEIECLMEE